ncbi:MAG: hypothetical protein WCA22_05670 [Candidatus Binatus sp.]
MKVEDVLRKIVLLRRISTDKGALAAEKEAAHRLQKALTERYAIKPEDVPDGAPTTAFRLNWSYWQELFDEFNLPLSHFGSRGSARVGNSSTVYIRLAANQWWAEEKSAGRWQPTTRGQGVESLRDYLRVHAPKSYSLQRR